MDMDDVAQAYEDGLRRNIGADIGERVEVESGRGYYIVRCGWCGVEINPGGGFRETPRIGNRGFHFSCIEWVEIECRTLAANLATAGALCAAFEMGDRHRGERFWSSFLERNVYPASSWHPGCQRNAPGFEPDGRGE